MPQPEKTAFEGGPETGPRIVLHDPATDTWQDSDMDFRVDPEDGSVGLSVENLAYLIRKAKAQEIVWVTPGLKTPMEELSVVDTQPSVKPGSDETLRLEFAVRPELSQVQTELSFFDGQVILDEINNNLVIRGRSVHLQPKETKLLFTLMTRPDTIVSRQTIGEEVWGSAPVRAKTLTQYISRCRRAFGQDGRKLIIPFRELGYMFVTKQVDEGIKP